jgi:hypothetical protein
VDKEFGSHYQVAHDRLGEALGDTAWKEFLRRPLEWAQLKQHKGWIDRVNTVVDQAWDPDEAQRLQRTVTDEVTEAMWRAYGHEFLNSLTRPGPGAAGLALLSGDSRDGAPDESPDSQSRLPAVPTSHAPPGAAELTRGGIGAALRALPGAALQARAFALRLAAPDGEIPAAPDERTLNDAVRDLAGLQRQLLLALSVVVGDTELAKDLNKQAKESGQQVVGPSEMVANLTDIASNTKKFRSVVNRLLAAKAIAKSAAATAATGAATTAATGAAAAATTAATGAAASATTAATSAATAATAATTAATGAAAAATTAGAATTAATATVTATATAAVVGGEATATGAGAGVAGVAAGSALGAALTAAGVAAVGVMVIRAGNRAVRERDRVAYARLAEWRAATQTNILTNTEDLLRTTREIVERRLCLALGADEDLNRRFRLRQAIEEVRRDRALTLETLRDDHLG